MSIVTIDFETYYDKDYSLKKMTTEAYIRDPRFQVIGVGIKIDDGQTDWYSGDRVGQFLNSIDYTDKAILCHNTMFDGAILSWHYGIKPKLWLDTLSMARPKHSLTVGGSLAALATYYKLNAKGTEVENALGKRREDFDHEALVRYAEYCCNDVDITFELFKKLKVDFPVTELLIIDRTIRMYTEPHIVLDEGLLNTHLANVIARKDALLDSIHVTKDELMSNNKFADVLRSLGVEPPTKISLRTGKESYAFSKTDKGMEELQDHPDEMVQAVVAARLGVKSTLEETRTQALIGVSQRGKLPIMLNYYGAHTGRFSGGDKLNLQNLPSRGDNTIRRAIRAEEGHVLVSCDSSQIEARTVAWLAGQNDLVQAFAEGRDVYSEFASEVYGRPISKGDKVERFVGKTCIAEGTLILTDKGEVPIQDITLEHRVWDGVEWVTHKGLIYQGIKDVITYQGLTATPDHGVYTDKGAVPFGVAASRLDTLITTGVHGKAVRLGKNHIASSSAPQEEHLRVSRMYQVWQSKVDIERQLGTRYYKRVSVMHTNQESVLESTWQKVRLYCSAMLKPIESAVQKVWGAWSPVLVQYSHGVYTVGRKEFTTQRLPWCRDRQGRQQRSLRTEQFTPSIKERTSTEQGEHSNDFMGRKASTALKFSKSVHAIMDSKASSEPQHEWRTDIKKVRVYDIANAGPRRRYTANGKLVLNCILGLGYGMGAEKFRRTLEIGQAGVNVIITLEEAQRIVQIYRTKNHKIVALWTLMNHAIKGIAARQSGLIAKNVSYDEEGIRLPNGFYIRYPALRLGAENNYEYIADPRQYRKALKERVMTGKADDTITWTKIYGGKATENVVQALARIVVAEQMILVGQRYPVLFQVHDELIITAPATDADNAQKYVEACMSTRPKWAPDLPIACESGVADNYGDT